MTTDHDERRDAADRPNTARPARRGLGTAVLAAAGFAILGGWLLLLPAKRSGEPPAPPARADQGSEARERGGTSPELAGEPGTAPGTSGPPSGPRAPAEPPEVRGLVLDESDRPIAGADVVLAALDVAALRGVPAADGARLGATTSERDGSFALPAPTQALARLTASAPGRATAAVWIDPAGARLTLRLLPEAVLIVEVVDGEGAAVPGAEVEARVGRLLARQTAPTGTAEVRGLPEGEAAVRATAPGGAGGEAGPFVVRAGERRRVLLRLDPGARLTGRVVDAADGAPIAGATVVVAEPGRSSAAEPTGADGRFPPVAAGRPGANVLLSVAAEGYAARLEPLAIEAEGEIELQFALTRAAPWSGRVEDASGGPAAGARVRLTSDGVAGRALPETRADAEGRFTLPAPPPPAPGRRVVLVAEGPGGRAALALRPDPAAPDPLVLRLVPGASVRGRVNDAQGKPLIAALARLQPAWDRIPDREGTDLLHAVNADRAGGLTALTDASGAWQVDGVPAGLWRLVLEHEGASRGVNERFAVGAGEVDLGTATLGGGLSVKGRVTFDDGRPAAGVRVRALAGSQPHGPTATTDAGGFYALADLVPGPHVIEASLGARARQTARLDLTESTTLDLRLPGGSGLALEVACGTESWGGLLTVSLARRAEGVAGHRESVRVVLGRADLAGLPAGTWWVEAEAAGGLFARSTEPVDLAEGRAASVRLTLAALADLSGTLLGGDGRPVSSGRVNLVSAGRPRARSTVVDARGRYRFSAVPPGDHEVTASGRGGAPTSARVAVEAGRAAVLDLRLGPAGSADVRVVGSDGRPVAGALLVFRDAEGRVLVDGPPPRTDADGRARREDLPVGRLLVSARAADGREARAAADVAAGSAAKVDLMLGPSPTR